MRFGRAVLDAAPEPEDDVVVAFIEASARRIGKAYLPSFCQTMW